MTRRREASFAVRWLSSIAAPSSAPGHPSRSPVWTVLLALALASPVAAGDGVPGEDPGGVDQGTVIIAEGDAWRFFRGTQAPPEGWKAPEFDDSAWEEGPTGIGYGDGDDRTILEDMRCPLVEGGGGGEGEEPVCAEGGYLAFFARRAFERPEVPEGQKLFVKVSYDDGFVLYLNGAQVRRMNMPEGEISHETRASSSVGDAPGEPDAVIVLPAELLRDGRNVLAASVHNVNSQSSDASFIPRLLVGDPEGEPPPEPTCEERCAARAAEKFQACLAEGLTEEECRARKQAIFEECVQAECKGDPPPEPKCEEVCAAQAAEKFQACLAEGGTEEECRVKKHAAFEECLSAECEGEPPPETGCEKECAQSGTAVYEACLSAGGNKEDCGRRANAIVALCLERCGVGAPCEDRCAIAAQIVLTGCEVAGLEEEECAALANGVLERCVAKCEPVVSCEGRCADLAALAVDECLAREGTGEECEAAGAAVLKECLAHCEGEPVPPCDEQCEGKANEMVAHCVKEGGTEADCLAERQSFIERCKAELAEICEKERLALESAFQPFLRGDSDGDGTVNITDPIAVLGYLFLGAAGPACEDAADANDDGRIDVSDPVTVLGFLFLGAGPLPAPSAARGQDPTTDLMLCDR